MATSTLTYVFTWENESEFKLTRQADSEEATTVIEMEENGSIGSLWPHIKSICMDIYEADVDKIGNEMKA